MRIEELPTYATWAPGVNAPAPVGRDWRVLVVARGLAARDRANIEAVRRWVRGVDPHGEHTAWVDGAIAVDPLAPMAVDRLVEEIWYDLREGLWVFDEDLYYEILDAARVARWQAMTRAERVEACDLRGVSIFAARRAEPPAQVVDGWDL